jgi:LAO/AO transport system kinase
MEQLARTDNVFIRPSPSQAALGGVGRRTRESIALVEAWGADLVLVETVGVGQSETMVAEVTDIFVLMLAPAGGDELQGVKRGIMEMADLVLVNKADGTLAGDARRTCAEYAGALRLMRPRPGDPEGYPRALCVSARTGDWLSEAWEAIEALAAARQENGNWAKRRRAQAEASFHHALETGLIEHLDADPRIRSLRSELATAVADGRLTPDGAAERIIHETFTPLRP